ncbi:hypothetical protein [Pseudonocardia sp. N23]|uniref:hypothetical protein n=1 Tax=Pseudonocardia sp. N23 TaxID=1987376 RepID=UPI000BFC8AC9|nr:hypothetical protein [Pseudonocardia sp. N23]GAY08230.1 hypothetical protein TOK_1157 [Pseudonocardia sp. N23]
MQITKTARRAAVGAVIALPLVLGVPGVAFAGDSGGHGGHGNGGGHNGGGHGGHDGGGHGGHDGGGHDGGGNGGGRGDDCDGSQTAAQGGGLADVTAAVNPALNVGNILNLFGTQAQNAQANNNTNSGIQQFGCGDGGQGAFQAGDVVSALVGVNPAANVGNIGNVGGTQIQNAEATNNTNSGVQQVASGRHQSGDDDRRGGRHHRGGNDGGDQTAVQGPKLIGIDADISPALNVGNILNLGGTQLQNANAANNSNSGVQQAR